MRARLTRGATCLVLGGRIYGPACHAGPEAQAWRHRRGHAMLRAIMKRVSDVVVVVVVVVIPLLAVAACAGDDSVDDLSAGTSGASGAGGRGAEGGSGASGASASGTGGSGMGGSMAGGSATGAMSTADAAVVAPDGGGDDAASCDFAGEQEYPHDSQPASHVDVPPEPSSYNSDPPSSGPHCPVWGEYTSYAAGTPLPSCNFIHNLEHGAIALLYNCPQGCPEIVAPLEEIRIDPPTDPDCPLPRILVTPYAEMQTKVAAVAWGYTWTSDCFDEAAKASLVEFIAAHLGSAGDAPEPTVCQGGDVSP